MSKLSISRFAGTEAWSFLSPEEQATIGALALELVACWAVTDAGMEPGADPRIERVDIAFGDHVVIDRLQEEVSSALPRESFFADDDTPRVPMGYGQICRRCGCSHSDACAPRCNWAEDDLCSACVDGAPARLTYVHADRCGAISFLIMPPVDGMLLLSGPDAEVREFVTAHARHAYDGKTLLVPGIPEADGDAGASDAFIAFRDRLEIYWVERESEVAS